MLQSTKLFDIIPQFYPSSIYSVNFITLHTTYYKKTSSLTIVTTSLDNGPRKKAYHVQRTTSPTAPGPGILGNTLGKDVIYFCIELAI